MNNLYIYGGTKEENINSDENDYIYHINTGQINGPGKAPQTMDISQKLLISFATFRADWYCGVTTENPIKRGSYSSIIFCISLSSGNLANFSFKFINLVVCPCFFNSAEIKATPKLKPT